MPPNTTPALQRSWSLPANGTDPLPELPSLGGLAGRRLSILLLTRRRRRRIEGLLAAYGCWYRHLRESAPALEFVDGERPDALIVDLPRSDRDAVAAKIGARGSGAPSPRLIALVSDRSQAEAARRAGYAETLIEPLSLAELQGALLGLAADVADAEDRGGSGPDRRT